jgi:nucleoside-diphosphate-sugar epimerase
VFHLAAIVSGEAEANTDLGYRVNLDGTRAVLDACRALRPADQTRPRLVFASSLAVYGGALPPAVGDDTALTPRTSYGTQKALGELLVNDYSRKGFVDGRALRLPTVVVRPGRPNRAASTFASSIIREPLAGQGAVCPVAADTVMALASPRRIVEGLVHALDLPGDAFGASRSLQLPGFSVSVGEMAAALRRAGGDSAYARIRWEPDPVIQGIVSGWPRGLATPRADALGFGRDSGIDEVVEAYIEDDLSVQKTLAG